VAILVQLMLRLLENDAPPETDAVLSEEERAVLDVFEQRVRLKGRPRRRTRTGRTTAKGNTE
jgi:hypothetical protein